MPDSPEHYTDGSTDGPAHYTDRTADPLAAALEKIRDRAALAYASPARCAESQQDVPRLLAVAAAFLDGHVPVPLYLPARHGDGRDGASACTHDPDHASHFEGEDGEWLCGDSPAGFACAWCRENLIDESEADWPCPVYVGALEALTGEKVPDGDGR